MIILSMLISEGAAGWSQNDTPAGIYTADVNPTVIADSHLAFAYVNAACSSVVKFVVKTKSIVNGIVGAKVVGNREGAWVVGLIVVGPVGELVGRFVGNLEGRIVVGMVGKLVGWRVVGLIVVGLTVGVVAKGPR